MKYSKLQNKSKIKKFWKRINHELNAPPDFICTLLLQVDHKNLFCTPVFTKLHPSYHLNPTQPDHAMWQSPPLKISKPEQATCHNPPLTQLTTQILPHHHLLHLTHETLTLIFFLSFQPPQPPPHLFIPPHHHRPATTPHLHLHVSPATTDRAAFHHHRNSTMPPLSFPQPSRTIAAPPRQPSSPFAQLQRASVAPSPQQRQPPCLHLHLREPALQHHHSSVFFFLAPAFCAAAAATNTMLDEPPPASLRESRSNHHAGNLTAAPLQHPQASMKP